ncbi:MAG: DUF2271 domain-containing protein [Calditrichaceae bacterium]|nr:DUF2271 domain-containing protein [Calditrichaceae bacterium]MBN2709558.1 DUF2271 domain-containing protein [Calditrichaceae bacterium]RQV96821.1 MAG: DUF2271 domain-containing protein [Calditrichota bacterium]
MFYIKKSFFVLVVLSLFQVSYGQTLEEYIQKAEGFNRAGDLEQAAKIMEEAVQKYPDNSTACSYLGLYRGSQAGRTQNYMEAGRLIGTAYEMLEKAVALEPENPIARFHRGLMGIQVPPFLNQLDQGIQDLEYLSKMYEKSPGILPTELMASTYNFLGQGYQKKEDNPKAIAAWEKVIKLVPGSDLAKGAEQNIKNLSPKKESESDVEKKYNEDDVKKFKQQVEKEADNVQLLLQLGKAYMDTENFEKARITLNKVIEKDSTNVDAYKLLIKAIGEADTGYDERIYNDTDFRSKFAFEIVELTDKAVKIAPDNMELRLIRGSIGVMMPFFVGRLDQAMADLEMVQNSNVPKEIKAEAIYWLGAGYQKKAVTNWIKVISEYSKTDIVKTAFESMCPQVKYFNPDNYKKPYVVIDFVLGFQDELPPQTVIWVEDKDGKYIKTVYVSGFSGHVKDRQVNLHEWAESSQFKGLDAVTGASINTGQHIYVWDLKDIEGKKVKDGEYTIKVETAYWPSGQSDLVAAKLIIGKNSSEVTKQESDLIPYLKVKYCSDKTK